ncbi:thioredoxin domain-containing protein, partial [Staphylococcus epidermidis]
LTFPFSDFNNQQPPLIKHIYPLYKYNFPITFPIHPNINLNQHHEHPFYTLLKSKQPPLFPSQIKSNFTKFLLHQHPNILKPFLPCHNPNQIQKLISQ